LSVWITWEKQIRNRSLSNRFGANLYEFDYNCNQLVRYTKSVFKTLRVLSNQKDGVVFVQNPSVLLASLALCVRPFFGYTLIVDAHNSAIFPQQKWLQKVGKLIIRKADFTVVTNKSLANHIEVLGGNPLILPDPLPSFHNVDYLRSLAIQSKKVLFICSWASDEPYIEVLRAAEVLPDFTFYITGKSKGRELAFGKALPDNVILTGYLPDDDYHEMLATSEVILDLTTREDCLVCGAYEATALERPFIVSDKKAIRDYFKDGCVYVGNTAEYIVDGINTMMAHHMELKKRIEISRLDMEENWQLLLANAKSLISKE
jgi:glycosyltransferase involved in cell wall biosynthesis